MASEDLANLSLDRGAEEGFAFEFDDDEEEVMDLRWCVVGRFLCDKSIHVNSMMVRMADLWRPVKGVQIKEAKQGLFLFRFNHPLDMEEVLRNGPWTFDNHLLIMERVQIGVQIENIPLYHADFWVQVHDLPTGLMKETVGTQLANYIGSFVEYDKNNKSSFWRQYMRLRVKVDVRLPLKKNTKVKDRHGNWCTVKFKYEKLGIFCFLCGVLGHAENRCEIRFTMDADEVTREWSNDLRAEPRRSAGRQTSRWLLEERGGGSNNRGVGGGTTTGSGGGDFREARQSSGEQSMHGPADLNVQNNTLGNPIIPSHNSQQNPINPFQFPVGQQSLPINSPLISCPTITSKVNNQPFPPPSLVFRATTNKHSKKGQAIRDISKTISSFQSSTNHNLSLTPSVHVTLPPKLSINQPIIEPIILPDPTISKNNSTSNHTLTPHPTTLNNPPTSNHISTPHPNIPKVLRQEKLTPITTQHISHDSNNVSTPMHGPIHITDETDEPEEMEIHVERKRRRDEEIKQSSVLDDLHQHFLSAGPGSQDCRQQ
jgi:14-3-3 protein epsilon